jgi:hypothetical protein
VGEAANDLTDAEDGFKRRRSDTNADDEKRESRVTFSRKGMDYNIDKSSSVRASVALGVEDGKPKVRRASVEYRKEF